MTALAPSACRLALLLALLPLAACGSDKTPQGQIVAKVDGDDITRRDLQEEMAAGRGGNGGGDSGKAKLAVVDQLVTRRVLVAQAGRDQIDKTPEFLAAERRARDMLLAGMLVDRWAKELPPPGAEQVRAFVAANDGLFSGRKLLAVDQIRVAADQIDAAAFQPLKTNDEVAAVLTAGNKPFQRGRLTVDTLTLPPALAAQFAALAPNEPIAIRQGGTMTVNAVVGQQPAPVPQADRLRLTRELLTRKAQSDAVEKRIADLRRSAKLAFQPGFDPAASGGNGGPRP